MWIIYFSFNYLNVVVHPTDRSIQIHKRYAIPSHVYRVPIIMYKRAIHPVIGPSKIMEVQTNAASVSYLRTSGTNAGANSTPFICILSRDPRCASIADGTRINKCRRFAGRLDEIGVLSRGLVKIIRTRTFYTCNLFFFDTEIRITIVFRRLRRSEIPTNSG